MFRKMLTLLNFRFTEGWYFFLNCENTEVKISSKIFLSVSERHRWEEWVNERWTTRDGKFVSKCVQPIRSLRWRVWINDGVKSKWKQVEIMFGLWCLFCFEFGKFVSDSWAVSLNIFCPDIPLILWSFLSNFRYLMLGSFFYGVELSGKPLFSSEVKTTTLQINGEIQERSCRKGTKFLLWLA